MTPAASLGFGVCLVNKCIRLSPKATLVELLGDAIPKSDLKGRGPTLASFSERVIIGSPLGRSEHQVARRTGSSCAGDGHQRDAAPLGRRHLARL